VAPAAFGVRCALSARARLEKARLQRRGGLGHAHQARPAGRGGASARLLRRGALRCSAAVRRAHTANSARRRPPRHACHAARRCAGVHAAAESARSTVLYRQKWPAGQTRAPCSLGRDGGRGGRAHARSARACAGAARRVAEVRSRPGSACSLCRLSRRRAARRAHHLRTALAWRRARAAPVFAPRHDALTRMTTRVRAGLVRAEDCAPPRRCTARRRRCAHA
jgi:hypothetical protein